MIIVTGAGGTVGSELVKQLRAANVPFRVAYHSATKVAAAKAGGLDAVSVDFAKPETLAPAFRGAETLFLLFAGGMGQTEGEIAAVEAAKASGMKRIVKLSVIGAEGDDYSFAQIHRPVERAIEASGLAWTHLRPNGFMQNVVNYFAPTIRDHGAFYQPAGDAKISHVDVRDIARVAVAALTGSGHEEKAYTITGPEALTYHDVAAKLSTATGKAIRYVPLSDDDAKSGMVGAGIPPFYADLLVDLNRHYRAGGGSAVSDAVRVVTGSPAIDFDTFAREYATMLA
ncbi:MAG: SDR family oxidoreductase [Acidobacteria bacterium]|nr:SDR family oxidoreductase [Acidobacteriota bacterium]